MIRVTAIILSIIACFLFELIATSPAWAEDTADDAMESSFETPEYFAQYKKKPLAKPRPGKALVYILRYREPGTGISAGLIGILMTAPRSWWVFSDKTPIAVMQDNGYSYAYIEPGEHVIWATHKNKKHKLSAIRIKAKAGETYYLYLLKTAGVRLPRFWVLYSRAFKNDLKYIDYFYLLKKKPLKDTNKIIARNYDHAKATATNYPFTIAGSLPKIPSFFSPKKFKPKKYKYYTASSDITTGEPTANKALIYVMTPHLGHNDRQDLSLWTFADDKLLAITWRGNYGYALADPGEHVFWTVFPSPWKNVANVNAIKMKVEAGKTYFLELNIQYLMPTIRVVNKKTGKEILGSFKYISILNKKGLRRGIIAYKRFNRCAAQVATQYPQTNFGVTWMRRKGSKPCIVELDLDSS